MYAACVYLDVVSSANSELDIPLSIYPLAGPVLNFMLQTTGTWSDNGKPESVTTTLTIGSSRSVDISVYDTRQVDYQWPCVETYLLGSTTVSSTGTVETTIPLTFSNHSIGLVLISFSGTDYTEDITLNSIVTSMVASVNSLYKLSDLASRWVKKMVWVSTGYWQPDPIDPGGGTVPDDPIEEGPSTPEYGWISTNGGITMTYGRVPSGYTLQYKRYVAGYNTNPPYDPIYGYYDFYGP